MLGSVISELVGVIIAVVFATAPIAVADGVAFILSYRAGVRGNIARAARWDAVSRALTAVLLATYFIALPAVYMVLTPTSVFARAAPEVITVGALTIMLITFPWHRLGRRWSIVAFWTTLLTTFVIVIITTFVIAPTLNLHI